MSYILRGRENRNSYSKGFTLIELLVVIAIIGLLSSVVLAALNTARLKGYDAARKEDINSLETALEAYYQDNGVFPEYGTADYANAITNLSSYLVPKYITSIPADPQGQSDQYVWDNNGNSYGMLIYVSYGGSPAGTTNPGWCITGVNVIPNWWNLPGYTPDTVCNF